MPFFQREPTAAAEFVRHPHTCRCTNHDYSRVEQGEIQCRDCGRTWRLHGKGWWPYPCPGCNMNPEVCRHYGKRPYNKPKEG